MDVEGMSIADIWRAAGSRAVASGLARPGYHSILRLVLDERRRRIERRNAIADAVDEAWTPTGIDYEAARASRRVPSTVSREGEQGLW
jgi:hypothetical protein